MTTHFCLKFDPHWIPRSDVLCTNQTINLVSDTKSTSSVDFADVLAVCDVDNDHYYLLNEHHTKKKSKSNSSSVLDISQVKKCYSFEIHYTVRRESKNLVERAAFCTSDFATVTRWVERLKQRVESEFLLISAGI